jgi:hypothetical protein
MSVKEPTDYVIVTYISFLVILIGLIPCFRIWASIDEDARHELNVECQTRCGVFRVDTCNDNGIMCANGKYYAHDFTPQK